jgi:adenosylhomocysteine nucleosidase
VGPQAARRIAERLLADQAVSMVVSAGFASALIPAQIGDLLLADEVLPVKLENENVMQGTASVICDHAVTAQMVEVAGRVCVPVYSGKMVSSSVVVWRARHKRELSRVTGAIGIDMESEVLGSVAARHAVPFVVMRTVSDLVDEELPLDFNLFLGPAGWAKGVMSMVMQPSSFIGLNRLRKQSRVAGGRLTDVFAAWVAEGERARPTGAMNQP